MRTTIHIFALLLLVASSGCATLFGGWHSESYFDQLAYDHADPETLRADLERTADYVKSVGLAAPEAPSGTYPVTEMMLIRDKGDKHHVTVRLRGSARLDKPGWVLVVRVESYSWDEEGTIAAGKDLLKKIGAWHAAGAGGG